MCITACARVLSKRTRAHANDEHKNKVIFFQKTASITDLTWHAPRAIKHQVIQFFFLPVCFSSLSLRVALFYSGIHLKIQFIDFNGHVFSDMTPLDIKHS